MSPPRAILAHDPADMPASLEFFKRTRSELRAIAKVCVYADRLQVFDVNHDYFELTGVGYGDADIVPLLEALNVPFNRDTIHAPPPAACKEFRTSRRYTWAQDRVM